MGYAFFQPVDNPPQFELGARTLFICVDPGQKEPFSKPIPCGANVAWSVVDAMRRGLNNERLRALELNKTGNAADVLDEVRVAQVVDVAGRVEKLKRLSHSVSDCDASIGEDLRTFSHKVIDLGQDIDASGDELKRTVRDFVGKHRILREYSPYGRAVDVMERVSPLVDVGRTLEVDTPRALVVQSVRDRLHIFANEVTSDAITLRNAMLDRGETLAALSAFGETEGSSYVIMTRDVNELLAEHGEALAAAIGGIRGLPFVDVVFCNIYHGDLSNLHAFAEALRLLRRASISVTLGEISSEQEAGKFTADNSKRGTFGAASLCLFAGSAMHRGFQVPSSVLVTSGRIRRDQGGAASMMEPCWGPQASKNLNADWFETTTWGDSTLKTLALEAGVNAVRLHDTQVRSPMFGRSPCSLRGYQFTDSNRLGALLAGNSVAWYEQVVPSTSNTPEVQRAWCQKAEEIFFGPFKHISGFKGNIKPQASSKLGTLQVLLGLQMPDPVEKIIACYQQL